jgi:hypothetical protein
LGNGKVLATIGLIAPDRSNGPDAVMIVAVHPAREGDTRSGWNAQLGLGAAAGGEVVAAVDQRGGEGAVLRMEPARA